MFPAHTEKVGNQLQNKSLPPALGGGSRLVQIVFQGGDCGGAGSTGAWLGAPIDPSLFLAHVCLNLTISPLSAHVQVGACLPLLPLYLFPIPTVTNYRKPGGVNATCLFSYSSEGVASERVV